MQISNPVIIDHIRIIADHYRTNVANHFTSRALATVAPSDAGSHVLLSIFTEQVEDYNLQGFHLEDLYIRLIAMAHYVEQLRTIVLPNIRSLVYSDAPMGQAKPADKVLRDMAIANFKPNLGILADRVKTLGTMVLAYDQEQAGSKAPVSRHYPEMARLDEILFG